MKVTQITPLNRKKDNMPYWKVQLEGKELPLLDFEQPTYSEGDDMPEDGIKLHQSGNYYMPNKGQSSQGASKPAPKPWAKSNWTPKNDDDIMLQVAFKGAIELETHHIVPEGKIDTGRILQATNEMFAGLLMMRPQKEEK